MKRRMRHYQMNYMFILLNEKIVRVSIFRCLIVILYVDIVRQKICLFVFGQLVNSLDLLCLPYLISHSTTAKKSLNFRAKLVNIWSICD